MGLRTLAKGVTPDSGGRGRPCPRGRLRSNLSYPSAPIIIIIIIIIIIVVVVVVVIFQLRQAVIIKRALIGLAYVACTGQIMI